MTAALPPSAVIDTNAILDWLVFQDPGAAFGRAIECGALRWIATPAMLLEHRRLFASPSLGAWSPDVARLEAAWARWAQVDTDTVPACALRCTDADDQMFIDLALARRATWLLTRDRALLKLARRAATTGLRVLTPVHWQISTSASPEAAAETHSPAASRRP
ncbi:PIN domain nuclease [Methylibium sp. Pch-M]|uniref:PIN domain-containing protein n=1 Tax=Methylibium sp. Pch-M TaxID=2082386 RepID=UPI0010104C77|nr:PIN domain-containing protein [Methylibium sp. Pch-M]QAZ39217.1 PIN domain nuclease [Methylibium sp. Pch-M]